MQKIVDNEENLYFDTKTYVIKPDIYLFSVLWKPEMIAGPYCTGFIVQKVTVQCDIPGVEVEKAPYYEAWRVEVGSTGNEDYDDKFYCAGIENTGSVVYEAEVYWIDVSDELYSIVSDWKQGAVTMANELMASARATCVSS